MLTPQGQWTARMNEWAERIDGIVDDLQRRMDQIERDKNGGTGKP